MDNRFTFHDCKPTHPPLTLAQLARKEQERLERIYTTLVDFDRQAAAVIWQQARAWQAHAEELDMLAYHAAADTWAEARLCAAHGNSL